MAIISHLVLNSKKFGTIEVSCIKNVSFIGSAFKNQFLHNSISLSTKFNSWHTQIWEREKEKKEADKASAFCHLQLDKLFYYNLKIFWFCRQFVSDLRRVHDTESVEYIVCMYIYVHNYYCQLVKGLTSNSSYTQHRKNKTFYFETHDWFFSPSSLLFCFGNNKP